MRRCNVDTRELIRAKIQEYRPQMLKMLEELIAIDSRQMDPEEGKPFGPGVQEVYEYIQKKAAEDGFSFVNADNYGGHLEWTCDKDADAETMGMLVHLDIVPAGDGWSSDPFKMEIRDGKIYGRGSVDDKGPAVSAYFAMKAIHDLGIKLDKNVRIIIGLDEETNWKGMDYYLSKVEGPDFGFVPDAEFPVINGEKGIIAFSMAKKFPGNQGEGLELRSFTGGNAVNMVPDGARMVVMSNDTAVYEQLKEKAAKMTAEGKKVTAKGLGKTLEIVAEGVSAHGARPELGVNAISIMMEFASDLTFNNEGVNEFIRFYNEYLSYDPTGEKIGVCVEDEKSGHTNFNVGVIEMDDKSVDLQINVRIPVTYDDEYIYNAMMPTLEKYNIGIVKGKSQKAIYFEKDDPMVSKLMDVYRRITGDAGAEPEVIGGGTYARACKNFVAFGPVFPGEDDMCHRADEFISEESFYKAAEIYGEAIYELCKAE